MIGRELGTLQAEEATTPVLLTMLAVNRDVTQKMYLQGSHHLVGLEDPPS
jgi:hypothetical protein